MRQYIRDRLWILDAEYRQTDKTLKAWMVAPQDTVGSFAEIEPQKEAAFTSQDSLLTDSVLGSDAQIRRDIEMYFHGALECAPTIHELMHWLEYCKSHEMAEAEEEIKRQLVDQKRN